jgi:hypothetical protein
VRHQQQLEAMPLSGQESTALQPKPLNLGLDMCDTDSIVHIHVTAAASRGLHEQVQAHLQETDLQMPLIVKLRAGQELLAALATNI